MRFFALVALTAVIAWPIKDAQAQLGGPTTYVQGSVCSLQNNGMPVPGLTVSLVHPMLGRSAPTYTNELGQFTMVNVPINPQAYFIELYWGNSLIYRNTVHVAGPTVLPQVCI